MKTLCLHGNQQLLFKRGAAHIQNISLSSGSGETLSVCCSVCILFAHMLHLIKCVTERCLWCFKYITTLSDPTRAWQVASCYRCVFFPPRRHTGHQTVWSMDLDVAVCKPERKKPADGSRFASGETLQTFFSLISNVHTLQDVKMKPHRTLQDDL